MALPVGLSFSQTLTAVKVDFVVSVGSVLCFLLQLDLRAFLTSLHKMIQRRKIKGPCGEKGKEIVSPK